MLTRAIARRGALLRDPQTNVARVVHGAADGFPGLVIERYADVLIAQLHAQVAPRSIDAYREICEAAQRQLGARAVYRKTFPRDRSLRSDADFPELTCATPWLGCAAEPEILVREHGLNYLVRPYDGYATGLFLDHRENRRRLREAAAGRRLLNAFAYTCAYAVAAAAGGAAHVVNVDVSKKALEWGKRNLAANGMDLRAQRFIGSDVIDYYRRAARQGHRFDAIVLDPPTFSRVKGTRRVFSVTRELATLVGGALALLDPGGMLQLTVNHRQTTLRDMERVVREAAHRTDRRVASIEALPLPSDFAGDPAFAKSLLAVFGA